MTGLSDQRAGSARRDGHALDGLARAAASGLSRREVAKLGGVLALSGLAPGWARAAQAAVGRAAQAAGKMTGACPAQSKQSCPGGELRGDWTPGCSGPVAKGVASEFNGCGPQGGIDVSAFGHSFGKYDLVPDTPFDLANFFHACKGHDCCYGHCGSPKGTCDGNFLLEMEAACQASWPTSSLIDTIGQSYCLSVAKVYYNAVSSTQTGTDAYNAGQKEVCDCCVDCQTYAKTLGYYNYDTWRSCPDPESSSGYSCTSVCADRNNCGACGNKCPPTINGYNSACQDGQCVGDAGVLDYCTACQGRSCCMPGC